MSKEMAELRAMDHYALAAEAYVLRDQIRFMQKMAETALRKHRDGDALALICEMHNLSIKCSLLPENRPGAADESCVTR